MEEFAKGLRLSRMIVEEWEEYKAKLKRTPVTGTITFLKGNSAKKATEIFRTKRIDATQNKKGEQIS